MVAGSKGPPLGGLQFKRCGFPPRFGAILLAGLVSAACGLGTAAVHASPSPSPRATVSPSPSPSAPTSYWVLATLGLRLHQAPDPAATVVTVLRPGAQLDATATQTIGGTTWLHVHAHNDPAIDGWVVNDPGLLTDIPMQQHDDTSLGYSLLFPANWTYTAVGATQSQFTPADGSLKLLLSTADTVAHLPPAPATAGKADHEEGPVDVYGKSPLITFYKLTAGGFELDLSFLWAAGRAYGFSYREPAADSSLLKQILASVIIH